MWTPGRLGHAWSGPSAAAHIADYFQPVDSTTKHAAEPPLVTAASLAAALESEISKAQLVRTASFSNGYYLASKYEDDEVPGSPELGPIETPAELPTPMVLDL